MATHAQERNAKSEHSDFAEFTTDLPGKPRAKVTILFPGEQVSQYTGVIVEMWDHKDYGRGKRAYLAEFDETERRALSTLHTRAWNWCMRRGHPEYIEMSATNYALLVRAANFFTGL